MRRAVRPSNDGDADRRTGLALVPVSRETEERLAVHVDLLRRWQRVKNLVGPSTLQQVWTRHVADTAQLVDLAPEARRWVDLGSGAGFPGLVIAILLHGKPGAHVDLIESNERKCAFLRDVVRATGAPAQVHCGRIEAVVPLLDGAVDVVTARALAPLPMLLGLSQTLLGRGAVGMFPKGEEELAGIEASPDIVSLPSRTHPGGRILLVRSRQGDIGSVR
jgi:16S rRNA (guanine527-N7)-methyltransferase